MGKRRATNVDTYCGAHGKALFADRKTAKRHLRLYPEKGHAGVPVRSGARHVAPRAPAASRCRRAQDCGRGLPGRGMITPLSLPRNSFGRYREVHAWQLDDEVDE